MKNKKAAVLSLFLVLALLLGGITGCAPKEEVEVDGVDGAPTVPTAPEEKVYKWRYQHSWGAGEGYYFEHYANVVREMSGGRIDMQVFAEGQLFPTKEMPRAIARKTLEMGSVSTGSFIGEVPSVAIASIPMLIENTDQMMVLYYRYGMNAELSKLFEDMYGIMMIGSWPNDFGTTFWKDDFNCLADLDGRVNTSTGPMAEFLNGYGVGPVSIACGDMYTSLATGVIDGLAWGGASCAYDMGFFEVAPYMFLPYYSPRGNCMSWISVELYESLPADLQAILREGSYSSAIFMASTYSYQEELAKRALVRDYGGRLCWIPEEDIQAIRDFGEMYLARLLEKHPESKHMVDIVYKAWRDWGRIE